jgi:hypothetical protein
METEDNIEIINDNIIKINNMDTLEKLYQLFETINETVIHDSIEKICSYKKIHDDYNIFIMIDRELLQKILERIPKPKRKRTQKPINNSNIS